MNRKLQKRPRLAHELQRLVGKDLGEKYFDNFMAAFAIYRETVRLSCVENIPAGFDALFNELLHCMKIFHIVLDTRKETYRHHAIISPCSFVVWGRSGWEWYLKQFAKERRNLLGVFKKVFKCMHTNRINNVLSA